MESFLSFVHVLCGDFVGILPEWLRYAPRPLTLLQLLLTVNIASWAAQTMTIINHWRAGRFPVMILCDHLFRLPSSIVRKWLLSNLKVVICGSVILNGILFTEESYGKEHDLKGQSYGKGFLLKKSHMERNTTSILYNGSIRRNGILYTVH